MQGSEEWIAMFRRIPGDLHDGLTVRLQSGAEVVIQRVLKLEPDFVILRGRLSGTQEGGRVMCIPYNQLTLALIGRFLKDPEVEAIFGKGAPAAVADAVPEAGAAAADTPAEATPAADQPAAAPAPAKPVQPSKAALVAKLRDRLKDGSQRK